MTAPRGRPSLAIVGGGIFGLTAAIEAARLGIDISLFDRCTEVLQGASKLNNAVIHMGYHYPRSLETVLQSQRGNARFQSRFPDGVRAGFPKYSCVASERSLTTAKDYLRFCEDTQLPYRLEFPPRPFINREKVDLSIRVPEAVFDYRRLRAQLLDEVRVSGTITVGTRHLVVGGAVLPDGRKKLRISYNGADVCQKFDFVLNASYGNTNAIIALFGGSLLDLQYEISEVPVVSVTWDHEPIGVTVMDGPFCSLSPFGFSGRYTITHVESSILARSIGDFAAFDCQRTPVNDCRVEAGRRMLGDCNVCSARPSSNVPELLARAREFFPILATADHQTSYFAMRCVLAKRDCDDARPTLVRSIGPGAWTIVGGKVDTCLDAAEEFRAALEAHMGLARA